MGQKTDGRIFRQGVNKKNWEFKYIEKNKEESSLFLYKTLEIQRYLNQFFKLYKIKIHNCKILYSENSLQIFLSFYVTTTTFYIIKKSLTKYSKECKKTFKPLFSSKYEKRKKNYRNKLEFSNVKKIKRNKKLNITNILKRLQIINNYIFLINYHNKPSNIIKIKNTLYNKNLLLIAINFSCHNFNLNSTTNLIKFQKLLQSVLIYKKLKKKGFKYLYFRKKIIKNKILLNKFKPYSASTKELKELQEILQIVLNNRPEIRIRNFNKKKKQKVIIKKNILLDRVKSYSAVGLKKFQEILLKSLNAYTKNRICISITLQNLNRHKNFSYAQIKGLKQIFKQLRNFVKKSFFKEAINILLVIISRRKSAKVLAEFISEQFRRNQLKMDQVTISRKDNYFLGFLKQTIILLIKSEISCVKGMKIIVKGRFNRAPRARIRNIHFGKFSLQSFNSKIDYHQSTAYTVNGTFGIKV